MMRTTTRSALPLFCLAILLGAESLYGCTVLGIWDPPLVEVEERACRVDNDCATVRFEVDESLRNDPCLVAERSCDLDRELCTVSIRARDSDGDQFRDQACADVRRNFPPFEVDCDDGNPFAFPNADIDGDGFYARGCGNGAPEDCDDTRATAYPGATVEACDGVFSMCTDSTPPARRVVEDLDGDRYSPSDLDPSVCEDVLSDDGVLVSSPRTDCDDLDPNVYPGAPDVCDGRHNDCTNPIGTGPDAGEDVDGDGYASPTSLSCDPDLPGGLPNSDCDDQDPKTYPGAEESCDGIINNCTNRRAGEITRLVEDPDEDGFYAGNADCEDRAVNIECRNAAYDRFSRFCLPDSENPFYYSVTGMTPIVVADVDGNDFDEIAFAVTDLNCGMGSRLVIQHSSQNTGSPLGYTQSACDPVGSTARVLLAEADGDADLELITVSAGGVPQVYDINPLSNMTLAIKSPMGITVSGDAVQVGAIAGLATPVIVAIESTSLVYRPLDTLGVAGNAVTIGSVTEGTGGLLLQDVDGDAANDVVVYDGSSPMITVYPGDGSGGFDTPWTLDVSTLLPGVGNPEKVLVGDVEGGSDGDLDFVVAGETGLGVIATRGSEFAGLTVGVEANGVGLPLGGIVATDIAVRDLEGDGDSEIVYTTADRDTAGYIEEIGSELLVQHVFVSDLAGASFVVAGDFDRDYDEDIVVYAQGFEYIARFTSHFVSRLYPGSLSVDRSVDIGPAVPYDVDGDAAVDVVGASSLAGGEITLWRALDRSLSRIEELPVGRAAGGEIITGVAVGDVTGDLRGDVVVVSEATGAVGYIRGIGDLTFADRVSLSPFDGARAVRMADLDGDGLDEVLVAANGGSAGALAIYARQETGEGFDRTIVDTTTGACTEIAVGDVDADLDLDVAMACGSDGLRIWRNPGSVGGAWEAVDVYGGGGPDASSVHLADIDRDGTADVLSYRADLQSVRIDLMPGGSPDGSPLLIEADVASTRAFVRGLDMDADGDDEILVAGMDVNGTMVAFQQITSVPPRYVESWRRSGSGEIRSLETVDVFDNDYDDFLVPVGGTRVLQMYFANAEPWWNH